MTLTDLENWSFRGTALAVLGQPIKHSISPAMHNAALAAMAQRDPAFGSWRYFRFEVAPEDLPVALSRLHAAGFHGINLTVPHKVLAVSRVESIDPAAQPVGAVNTLRRTEHGWRGYNTDGFGLASGMREDLGVGLSGAAVILMGAGGAARGAAVECLQRGCAALWIGNRTAANRDELIAALRPITGSVTLKGFAPDQPPADLPAKALLINATSAGLRREDLAPIDIGALPKPSAVYDMIYNPPQTSLLRAAGARGVPAANGLSMLVHQGARALEIWSGVAVPVDAMRTAARQALSS